MSGLPPELPPGGPEGAARARTWGPGWALAGFVAGTALQLLQPALWAPAAYGALAALGLLAGVGAMRRTRATGSRRARGRVVRLLLLVLAGAALGGALTGWRATERAAQALSPDLEGRDLQVTGVVAAMPQWQGTGVPGLRFRLAVDDARLAGQPVVVPPMLWLGWWGGVAVDEDGLALQRAPGGLQAGERWQATVRLKAPHGHRNPHGFDHELWLWEQQLHAVGTVRAGPRDAPPRRLGDTGAYPLERARQQVRDAILTRLAGEAARGDGGAGPEAPGAGDGAAETARQRRAGIVAALVTGDQTAIDRADWDVFRATGVAHLMSISGLHITLFAWLAAALVGGLWRLAARHGGAAGERLVLRVAAPVAARVGGLVLATAYALFSGWGVPAQRTVLMLAVVSGLRLAGRRWPWPFVWLLAGAGVVAVDPWALLQAGFWLSFVAVGVLYASDSGAGNDRRTLGSGQFHVEMGRAIQRLLREQAVVSLALAPLTLALFGQVSLVGLVANLLSIPWVTLVVTPLALGGVLLPPLWTAAAWALQPLAGGLAWLATWPLASLSVPAAPWAVAAAAVAGGAWMVLRLPWRLRALGLPLLLPVLLWPVPRPAEGEFELLAADIGQGNAVLVRTARHSLVYDAGPRFSAESDAGHRVLVPLLRALGERVDTLVLSHRDTDHTGGARAVLAQQPQAVLRAAPDTARPLADLRPALPCEAGQRWHWDGVDFEVLSPPPDAAPALRPNARSCVLRLDNGRAQVLLAGDIEAPQEAALLAGGRLGPVDLLLVPHHGSRTSSSPAWLDTLRPRWSLVQAGYRNRFGHPAPEVVARYDARGLRLVRSDACGAAHWSSATPEQLGCERARAPRYWQHRP